MLGRVLLADSGAERTASGGTRVLSSTRVAHLLLILVLLASLATASALAVRRFRAGLPALEDFVAFYTGARLAGADPSRLYSLADQQRAHSEVAPGRKYMPFLRPPLLAALLWPLSRMPLERAAVFWLVLNAAAAFLLAEWCARRMGEPALLLLAAVFVPLLVALSVGQDTPLLAVVLVAHLRLVEARRPAAAGLLLAVLWLKPQWLPPFVLLLAGQKQWRALAGFGAASAVLMAVFPPIAYARFLLDLQRMPGIPPCLACMPNLRGLLSGLPGGAWLALVASVAVLAWVYYQSRRRPLAGGFALACCAALLAGYYSHIYDCLLLLPAVAVAGSGLRLRGQASQAVLGVAISPLPYLAAYWSSYLRPLPALAVLAVFLVFAASLPRETQATRVSAAPAGA